LAGRRVTRWGLGSSLALALLLISAPGALAATCTATNGGAWATSATWSCSAVPGAGDAVVIPAGKTVTIAAADSQEATTVTLRGTLALGDADSTLDATNLIASGGTITGPASAVTVTLAPAVVATVDASGLTVDGAALDVVGRGALAVLGPLTIVDGGWFESDVGTNWTGSAPWQLGGGADAGVASGFEVVGAQLTIAGATSAQTAPGAGDGVIQLDSGATLSKQDATTTTLAVDVVVDASFVQVIAGKLIGGLQGNAALSLSSGAALGLSGNALQLTTTAVNVAGGTLEVEPGADVGLDLPANPELRLLSLGAGASLDVGIGVGSGALTASPPAEKLAGETALAAGATLSLDGGGGTLTLADQNTLHGSGTLDASLANAGGTLSPSGALHVTGDFSQAAGGTLAIALRTPADGDSLTVDGDVSLAGTLRVTTAYAPAATAAPLVLAATAKPAGAFAKTVAPMAAGRAWEPSYTANGVALQVTGTAGGAAGTLARPSLRPKGLVVGGTAQCVPPVSSAPRKIAFRWLRAGKPIRGATRARYLLHTGDRGRAIACRITVVSAGTTFTATSDSARARTVLAIASAVEHGGHTVTVAVRCAASERTCSGSLHVVVGRRAVAGGRFSLRAPGGLVQLPQLGAARIVDGAAVIHATYRNQAGAARTVTRRLALAG
jgi:hypothetical protein